MTETVTVDKDRLFELLVQVDRYHELLGAELLPAFEDGYFDPDANYTPLEERIHRLAELFGFDYKDIRNEAYRRNKEDKE